MNKSDRSFGMRRDISRRDFLNGVALSAGSLALPLSSLAAIPEYATSASPLDYPPWRMGMRGSHSGSFEAAHQLRDSRNLDLSGATNTGETYDLVVVEVLSRRAYPFVSGVAR